MELVLLPAEELLLLLPFCRFDWDDPPLPKKAGRLFPQHQQNLSEHFFLLEQHNAHSFGTSAGRHSQNVHQRSRFLQYLQYPPLKQ